MKYKYLSVGSDAKTIKGEKKGYLTGILYLAPAQEAGGKTLCPFSTPSCRQVCLFTAGRGAMSNVRDARIRKTKEFMADPKKFVEDLTKDIKGLIAEAAAKGMIPAVRLNGTTDIKWENYNLLYKFPDLQFYDYTKWPPNLRECLPKNYHITFSHSESGSCEERSKEWFNRKVNTAVVFRGELPVTYQGRAVINGDESDLRFTDPVGVIVGLKVKGKARPKDAGKGFVVEI
jgi:hypothetical protein